MTSNVNNRRAAIRLIVFLLFDLILVVLAVFVYPKNNTSEAAIINEYNGKNYIAKQHQADACLLGALATSLNYLTGGYNYTSQGVAMAYRAKYGKSDWALDGNTSHQTQLLANFAGFQHLEFDHLNAPQNTKPVDALTYLAWSHSYAMVFLDGQPQHAIVLIDLLKDNKVVYADPIDGQFYFVDAAKLYARLEAQKWYFRAK